MGLDEAETLDKARKMVKDLSIDIDMEEAFMPGQNLMCTVTRRRALSAGREVEPVMDCYGRAEFRKPRMAARYRDTCPTVSRGQWSRGHWPGS